NTDCNWLSAGCKLLMPIVELIKGRLLKLNSVLHIDETWTSIRIKIAGDGTKLGRYKKKYIWCAVNEAEKVTCFFYDNDENDSRGLRPIQEFLAGFEKGAIQSDAYTVYELL
ncbi:transposase, partial [Parabacteroides distasonis]